MEKKMIRVWLEKNKIFFEIFSSVLLGLAAIFVAYASYQVSEAQLEVSRVATEPHFYLEETLFLDAETQMYNEEELRLYNAGAPAYNIYAFVRTFIVVDLFKKDVSPVFVPVIGYFSAKFLSQSPEGLIATFKGHLNNHYSARLHFATLNQDVMKGRPYFEHHFVNVTVVSYRNSLGEDRKIAFRDRSQVDPDDIAPLLKLYWERRILKLKEITVDSLLEAVSEQINL